MCGYTMAARFLGYLVFRVWGRVSIVVKVLRIWGDRLIRFGLLGFNLGFRIIGLKGNWVLK